MNKLLSNVLQAHGGLAHRNSFDRACATVTTTGAFWEMKGLMLDHCPCHVTVWLHQEHSTLESASLALLHNDYTPSRIAILNNNGNVIAERENPRASFAGHVKPTWWDPLQLAYFEGYALWTYLNTPFLLAAVGVEVMEVAPWTERGATWRVLRAQFHDALSTHSVVQEFFFDENYLLRRHDYRLDVAGGFDATNLLYEYITVDGLSLPTQCRAYTRGPDRRVILDPLMVSIDITNLRFIRNESPRATHD
jgi:hypothetical protein